MVENRPDVINLREYVHVVLKRRWTVISLFTIVVITVTIHAFTATPTYKATTRLIIDRENPNVVSIQEVMAVDASGTDYYQTQYKIIESRTVAREVVKRLHLKESEEFFPNKNAGFFTKMIRSIGKTLTSWSQSTSSLLKSEGTASSVEDEEIELESTLVTRFIRRIEVEPIRNSRLVDVNFKAKNRVLSSKIANAIVEAYIDMNLATKLDAVQDAVKWLHTRIEDERVRVEKAELALLQYKERHSIVTDFSSDVEKITAQKLAQLNAQVVDAESRRVEAQTRYEQANSLLRTPDLLDSIPAVLKNELIRQIKSMEVELYKKMSELSEKYGQKHPKMVAISSELKTLQERKAQEINRVIASLKNEYQVAMAKENSLEAAFVKQKRESLTLNQKAINYGSLRREAESARHMYGLLIKRFKEASVTEDMRTGNIRVVDRAEVPRNPFKPRKKLNILLAVIVGLVSGFGMAFFLEIMDNTIKLPDDIKKYLQIPYLGPIPAMNGDKDWESEEQKTLEMITQFSSKSTASEAYRGIRTSILLSSAETEPQVILVSSAGPQEGKTLTTTNLAISMAQSGNKVIMLDCDMRRPKIHKIFGITRDKGMTNLLVGNQDFKGTLFHTDIPNLDVIPCGPIPPNPSEILGSSRMVKLIELLRKNYTRILIDSPPITAVTDAVVLAKNTDGVVLIIRANDTAREIIKNGLDQIQAVGAHVLGAVLNGVEMGRDGFNYYQYYYYYYGEDTKKGRKPGRRKRSKNPYNDAETKDDANLLQEHGTNQGI